MQYRIYIKDFLIKADSKNFKRKLQVNKIGKLTSRQSNFTSSISIHKTAENYRFFELVDQPGVESDLPYIILRATIYSSSGYCLTKKGLAYIEKVNEDKIILSIYDGFIDFIKAIQNKTLNDVNIDALDHVKNVNTVKDSWENDFQYRYLIADFNGKNVINLGGNQLLNIDFQVPFANVEYLWNRIFDYFGWTYEGLIFDEYDFKDLWLSFPKSVNVVDPEYNKISNQDADLNRFKFDETEKRTVRFLSNPGNILGLLTIPEIYFVTEYFTPSVIFLVSGDYRFTITGRVFKNFVNLQLDEEYFHVYYAHYDSDFNLKSEGTINTYYGDENSFNINVEIDDRLVLRAYTDSIENDGEILYGTDNEPLTFQNNEGTYDTFTTEIEEIIGDEIDFSEAFQNFLVTDFLKEIMMRFGLTPFMDRTENHIKFKMLYEILDFANAINFSNKYVRTLETSFVYKDYAKKNIFKFKYDNVDQEHTDGSLIVNNLNLDEQKTIFESKTYSPLRLSFDILNLGNLVPFKLWERNLKEDGTIDYRGLKNRFYFSKSLQINENLNIGSEQLAIDSTSSKYYKARYDSCDWSSLVSIYYNKYQSVIRRSKVRIVELYIDEVDYQNLDFSRLIYIKQLSSYFLIDQVGNFVQNKPTKFYLLEISDTDGNWYGVELGIMIADTQTLVEESEANIDSFNCFKGSLISLAKQGLWVQGDLILFAQIYSTSNLQGINVGTGLTDFEVERATTATRVNSDLLIEEIAVDTAKINYKKNECSHLLLEPQRTNLIDYSEDFINWDKKFGNDIIPNSSISPDGNNNATYISSLRLDTIKVDLEIDQHYIFSVFAKKSIGILRMRNRDNDKLFCEISLESNTFNPGGSDYLRHDFVKYPNDWFKINIYCKSVYGSSNNFNIRAISGDIYIWGAQIEKATIPTSYIPTNGSTVTRNQDIINKDLRAEIPGEFSVLINLNCEESVLVFNDNMTNVEIPATGKGVVVLNVQRHLIELHWKNSNDVLQSMEFQNLSGFKVQSIRSDENATEIKNLIYKQNLLSQEDIETHVKGQITIDDTYDFQKKYNTWIGGMGATLPTTQDFIDHLNYLGRNNLTIDDIINYEVDSNGNARYFAKSEYYFHMDRVTQVSAGYIFDLDKKINKITAYNPISPLAEYFMVPNAKIAGFDLNFGSASDHQLKLLVSFLESNIAGHMDNLDTPGVDSTAFRRNGNGADLIVSDWLSTNNAGSPDGDIGVFIANGGTVTYKDLSDPTQNEYPKDIEDLSAVTINTNSVEVSFTTELTQGWIIIFVDGFLKEWVKIQDFTNIVSGLNSSQSYEMNIILADQYFNITRFSNTLEFTTT